MKFIIFLLVIVTTVYKILGFKYSYAIDNFPPNKPPPNIKNTITGGSGDSNNPDILLLKHDTVRHLLNDWTMISEQDTKSIQKMRSLCNHYDQRRYFYFAYQPLYEYRRRIRFIFHAELLKNSKYTIEFTHGVFNPYDVSGLPSYPLKNIITNSLNYSNIRENGKKNITIKFDKLLEDKRFKFSWKMVDN